MIALVLLVGSIGFADSINPSTILPALWLVSGPQGGYLGSYTWGVFAVYFIGGLLLVFGPGPALITLLHHVRGPVEHVVELAGGIIALAFACLLLRSQPPEAKPEHRTRRCHNGGQAFLLGAGIMIVELPTAFVYFGAITAILAGHLSAPAEIALVVLYNVLFVAPLVMILVAHRVSGERFNVWLLASERRLRHAGHVVLTAVSGIGGVVLVVLGVTGLAAA